MTDPDDWLLTRCLTCGYVGHYRFVYVLDKNEWNEPTCRACYRRGWGASQRAALGTYGDNQSMSYETAQGTAYEHGYNYLALPR